MEVDNPKKIIRIKEVMARTGLSRSKIYLMLNSKSKYHDFTFPTPIHISSRCIGWLGEEIQQWVELKVEQSRNKHVR